VTRAFVFFLCCRSLVSAAPQAEDPIARALAQRQFEIALRSIDERLKSQPADARLWAMRGAALYGLRQPQASLAAYRKAIQLQPSLMPALQAAAQLEYAAKDPNASKTLSKILTLDPQNQVAHAMSGVLAFEKQDCAAVVRHFAVAMPQVERDQGSLQQYGYCLLQLNRGADAAPVFQRLLEADPADARVRLNLALSLAAANRPVEAIEALKPLSEAPVPDADVLGLLGELYRANNQPEPAVAAFRRGIALYPKEERLYIGLAALCSFYSSGELGLEITGIGLKQLPSSSRLYAMRGVLYSQMGQREKSIADFDRASQLSPEEGVGRTGLALSMLQEGRIDDVIRQSREQIRKNPRDAAGHFMLAQALLRKGARSGEPAMAEAQASLQKAVQLSPQFDQARALLGKLYFDSGKNALAVKELEAALQIKPGNRAAIYQLMLAYGALGREADAARMQEQMRAALEKERQDDLRRSRVRLLKIPE
jgi:tetratricopeptide (TPR) repeat protein